MKRFLILCLCLPLLLISCSKEAVDCEQENTVESNEYYIKYIATSSLYYLSNYYISYKDEHGEEVRMMGLSGKYFERIIGPVPYGFEAQIGHSDEVYFEVQCSKNGGPFAYKASSNDQLTYKIDF